LCEGDLTLARVLSQECLVAYYDVGRFRDTAGALNECAAVAASCQEPARALRLFAAATALRASIRLSWSEREQAHFKPWLAQSWAALDVDAAEHAWAAGLAMDVMSAIEDALAIEQQPRSAVHPKQSPRGNKVAAVSGQRAPKRTNDTPKTP
jgi:hypothetical protein